MNPTEAYHAEVTRILSRIVSEESENIRKAAGVLADCVEKGKLIHVFGTGGHSYIAGEEMFYRAGGLQPVNAILDPGVSLAAGARRSTVVERTPGYARAVLDAYGVSEGEAIVLVNVNGINSVTIESAMECKKRGVTVIGVTSREFSINVPPGAPARHPSNKNLFELADIVIDIHIPPRGCAFDPTRGKTQSGRRVHGYGRICLELPCSRDDQPPGSAGNRASGLGKCQPARRGRGKQEVHRGEYFPHQAPVDLARPGGALAQGRDLQGGFCDSFFRERS